MNKLKHTIPSIIWQQIGANKFYAMTGGYPIKEGFSTLLIGGIMKNKAKINQVRITLQSNDLYEVAFIKYKGPKIDYKNFEFIDERHEIIKQFNDVYCHELQRLFTNFTGLYTKLF